MARMILKYFLILLTFLLLNSCVSVGSNKHTPVMYYDLGRPQPAEMKLNIGSINSDGPFKTRMWRRVENQNVQVDEYRRWTQVPDSMLSHYLKMSFIPGGNVELFGEILSFENDLQQQKAVFVFHYQLQKSGQIIFEGIFRSEKRSSAEAADFAKAMSRAVADLRLEVSSKLKQK